MYERKIKKERERERERERVRETESHVYEVDEKIIGYYASTGPYSFTIIFKPNSKI
jgi:hypothetical protein